MPSRLSVEQCAKRFEKEADRHRAAGRWSVGHEYQRYADEIRRLARLAASLARRSR